MKEFILSKEIFIFRDLLFTMLMDSILQSYSSRVLRIRYSPIIISCAPNQAQMMFDSVEKKGIPCSLVMFEGEQHGFRKSENIWTALDGELYFYSKILKFEADLPDGISISSYFEFLPMLVVDFHKQLCLS
ncbi:hypothetical protein EB796_002867 [Bugula neritina]|uniref:Peptidase S9 prolyl oligopeptidase catalytic domain-containing protein n=1 Tax=Bugula neritina TaxID=10212 RepID=A0A7J7KJR4_BUGNE|nr:hypothetical protein EB796_002867 [Bugula neritina]